MIAKIVDDTNFVKDEDSGAVLNTNTAALSAYKKRKKQAVTIKNLESRLERMERLLEAALSEKNR